MNNSQTSEKLTIKEKLGFSAGEYSSSIVWQTLMFFLPVFYTDTFGLTAASVGTMFLIIRFFDAFNDPVMGIIADRTKTRWGKFRPYLLWFAAPYGILAMLMFTTPGFSYTGKLIYAYVTYGLMMVIYTIIMIPYNSWVGVISPNSEERTSVSSYKFVMAYLAGITVQALVLPMVEHFGHGDDAEGYKTTMIILGTISIIFFLITFFSAKERVQPEAKVKSDIKEDLKDLIKNEYWIIVFFTSMLLLTYIVIRSGAIMYYFEYYLGKKELASAFMVVGTIATLVGVLPTKWLSSKMGKRNLFIISLAIIAVSQLVFYIASPDNIVLIFAAQIVFSLASGPTMPLVWSMLADTADYSEWKSHRRATGLIFSATNMSIKTGVALGGAAIMWVLSAFGYVSNSEQTPEAIAGIKSIMSFIPAGIAILAIIPLLFYKLDDKKLEVIEADLKARKAE
jgi:GPH family glycoside/pentoside/hexuronide:cation symporter